MIKRQTWILFAVFAVLLIIAVFWTRSQGQKKVTPTPTVANEMLLTGIDESSITSLQIRDSAGKVVTVGRDQAGLWALTEPNAEYTDISKVEGAVTQLMSLRVLSMLTDTTNIAEYGLDYPAYTITIIREGGLQNVIEVGNPTPTKNGYYVFLDKSTLQIVVKYGLDSVLGIFTTPPIATATPNPTETPTETPILPTSSPTATVTP
jgi:hypothetical protein